MCWKRWNSMDSKCRNYARKELHVLIFNICPHLDLLKDHTWPNMGINRPCWTQRIKRILTRNFFNRLDFSSNQILYFWTFATTNKLSWKFIRPIFLMSKLQNSKLHNEKKNLFMSLFDTLNLLIDFWSIRTNELQKLGRVIDSSQKSELFSEKGISLILVKKNRITQNFVKVFHLANVKKVFTINLPSFIQSSNMTI